MRMEKDSARENAYWLKMDSGEIFARLELVPKPRIESLDSPPQFKIGDVVRLKSGGPNMAVSEPPMCDGDTVSVIWIAPDGDVKQWSFDPAMLDVAR